ncbi:hypothetical protein IB262_35190 [Ensifer sp. ENS02]|uniref:inositol monophosphatase family protein n=1 Tax=Ensifer sp. ENS02 TaxID=2769290 RepID=UPI00177CE9A7|nr:inositol monophosphatase family protein [Ensifer sp. ENS02]MBD9525101.1 hypothetical protein [Ensifer sp. ENS02]
MTGLNPRLELANFIALEAEVLARKFFGERDHFSLEEKDANEFVSDADRQVERLMRDRLAAELRGDAVMGEEMGGAAVLAATDDVNKVLGRRF